MIHTLLARLLTLGTAFLGWGALAVAAEPAVTLYVSPAGQDSWSGKLAEPNATRSDGPLAPPSNAHATDCANSHPRAGRACCSAPVPTGWGDHFASAPRTREAPRRRARTSPSPERPRSSPAPDP